MLSAWKVAEWRSLLGADNRDKNVDYVTKKGPFYTCLLCNAGPMHKNNTHRHFNSCGHAWNKKRSRILVKCETAIDLVRISVSLPTHSTWRLEAKALLYDYMMTVDYQEDIVTSYGEVEKALKKFHRMENLSLLELALWKARICDGVTFQSMQEMREYTVLEPEFDVQQYARDMRMSCGSEAVIPLVLSYLGPD